MEAPILTDKDQFPSEEIIYSHIGKAKILWQSFFEFVHTNHPDFLEQWRYYNDGKSWLLKVTRKSKTIFWLSVVKDSFKTVFYFPQKAEDAIIESTIPEELKEQFTNRNKNSKITGIRILFKNKKDIESAKKLIEIKLSVN